jgi:hypothetical protein
MRPDDQLDAIGEHLGDKGAALTVNLEGGSQVNLALFIAARFAPELLQVSDRCPCQ